jgi:broad specificity phosphatase PhoE
VPKSSTKETVEEERTPAEAFAPEPTVEDEPNTDRLKSETPGDNPLVEECIQRTYVEAAMVEREHAEFHNCYSVSSVTDDLRFLRFVHGEKLDINPEDVTLEFVESLKHLGKDIYFFIQGLGIENTPQTYIKRKYEFIESTIPQGNQHLFYLAWNGLLNNDSFMRVMRQKFNLSHFNDTLCARDIPAIGSNRTRYRTKLVLADDMANTQGNGRRTKGRLLNDGSGLILNEGIVWLPNGKAMPLFPQAYVPLNQTHVILIRHGRSVHESGGDNPEFVGSGSRDHWRNNRRISGHVGNNLHEDGIRTARELGKDFRVAVDTLEEAGYPLWSWSKETPILVYGSESENTEQTARYFLMESGYTNLSFRALYGLNSQKYGALTHRRKKDVMAEVVRIYGPRWGGSDADHKARAKSMFKNRFYHFPDGETLLESDWRIAYNFVDLLEKNLGKRIVLCDHSVAIRVFEAVMKTLDFADYSTRKEGQESILAICYHTGRNPRYDYLQHREYPLRER